LKEWRMRGRGNGNIMQVVSCLRYTEHMYEIITVKFPHIINVW
jgi:hypothetical protein